jgi:hypothetical protein
MSDTPASATPGEQQQVTTAPEGSELEVWQQARVCVAKIHRLASVIASREVTNKSSNFGAKTAIYLLRLFEIKGEIDRRGILNFHQHF